MHPSSKNETSAEEKHKSRLLSPLKVMAGALASVTAAIIGSIVGDAGTLIGIATASVITSCGAVLYEHGARKAVEKKPWKRDNPPVTEVFQALTEEFIRPSERRRRIPRKMFIAALVGAVLICAASIGIISILEIASGKTLHSITTGIHDPGTTVGGSSSNSSAPPTPPVKHHHHHRHHTTNIPSPIPSSSPTRIPSSSPSSSFSLSPSPAPSVSPSPIATLAVPTPT